jgi:hypothetical protein
MIKKAVHKVKTDNENGARKAILEDLFYDFHKSRRQVYLMNFFRGVSFGVGSILGGTVVVAVLIWLLNLLVDIPGGIGQFIQYIVNTVQHHATK